MCPVSVLGVNTPTRLHVKDVPNHGTNLSLLMQVYGAAYLQKLLEPLMRGIITSPEWQHISFEVDPTR